MFEQSLLDASLEARRGSEFFSATNSLTNSSFGVTKTPFHFEGCSCSGCHAHDDDGKDFQPGGAGTATTDTIPASTATTETLAPGSAVTSSIDTGSDQDWFRINLTAGETYTFTVYLPGGGLQDSTLTLRNSTGGLITTNDDANTGAGLYYSEITFTAPTTGTYYLDVGSWSTLTGQYYLSSSRPNNDDVGGSVAGSAAFTLGSTVNSTLNVTGDRDWYAVTLEAGQIYEFTTSSTGGGADADTTLTLRDASGNVLAWNDDSSGTYSRIRVEVETTGTYYIDVGGWADSSSGSYQLTGVVAPPLQEYTNDQIAGQLLSGYWGGTGTERRFNVSEGGTLTVNITALTTAGQFLAREALNLWSDVLGVTFSEVSGTAQITFDDNEEGAFASSTVSGGFIIRSNVNISTDWLANSGTTLDSYSFQTYLHEIGHALGLGHGGNYNNSASYTQDASYLNDSWATTVMSYFSQNENTFFRDQGFSTVFTLTPMGADIVAIQNSYGTSTTTRTGDSTYGVGNNTGRDSFGVGANATNNAGNLLAFTIIDHGGNDTVNYSTFSAAQLINLNPETFSNVGGSVGNMSIARGTIIENAVGGSGNDQLIGNDVANRLTGGLGNDTLDGGSNVDTAVVSGNRAAYTVTQTSTGVFRVVGADGTDTLTNVEFLQFTDQTIRLLPGTGISVNFNTADPSVYQTAMNGIRDFDGNALGGNGNWLRIGAADINGDGDIDQILVNDAIGRFATVGTAPDGLVYFADHSWAGETRVAGIYIDPLVASGDVVAGSPNDSQVRFQNDLQIENINGVLGADDYDGDGIWEVYFALTDGTAYLRAFMHADGNIRYANYQSQQQMIDYLTANGYTESTWGSWLYGGSGQEPPASGKPGELNNPVADPESGGKQDAGSGSSSGGGSGGDDGWMMPGEAIAGELALASQSLLEQQLHAEFFG
ncbi:M10 family metallopeptidase C-terminal domain-containing protein [Altererythrobacter sp. GH1-8]|uniref:M10 family metallopeptidase C-terminal domain-containing protein n=1 Tax=Altererythrobacter sp. GH1-8 TaxID=3349333 RepID=UPI00374C8F53